ncbi:unnamed protein product [Symbiodinium natans]|uniref:Uncharacterized protein n=1 Tax=Symbiodinium natans TaxID=878477 RepID=A0A812KF44_9DINO|nr:unnamed protein product [Symbiodinium natans]
MSSQKLERETRAAACPSYILQHYHSTGCCGGAFSFRAALMDPKKEPYLCTAPREFRETTAADIQLSLDDKRRGGGPRVGSFQEAIPGEGWQALPKYDFTTKSRSSAFNERMHVEWENHVDHILKNDGDLPVASVVAKAGFRSCAPCCRDMLALARPTGKTFIMVDLAENDRRGTFHFVTGDSYLPVPKEACEEQEVARLKDITLRAQSGEFQSSEDIRDAVLAGNFPIDKTAQALYASDPALLPPGVARGLTGRGLLEVLHGEHFARLTAEYGASILRDASSPMAQRQAVLICRARARAALAAAWKPHLKEVDVEAYANAAITPLLPEEPDAYLRTKLAKTLAPSLAAPPPPVASRGTRRRWARRGEGKAGKEAVHDDGVSTAVPEDDDAVSWQDMEDPDEDL